MSQSLLLIIRIVYGVMSVGFFWFASLQFNDIDAVYWIAVYAAVALSCLSVTFLPVQRMHSGLPALFCILLVVWIATLVPDLEGTWWDGEVERELGGLTIVLLSQLGELFIFRRMSRS